MNSKWLSTNELRIIDIDKITNYKNIKPKKNPIHLLNFLIKIEKIFGRIRKKKNEPRIIDLDIVDYKNQIVSFNKKLKISLLLIDLKLPKEDESIIVCFIELKISLDIFSSLIFLPIEKNPFPAIIIILGKGSEIFEFFEKGILTLFIFHGLNYFLNSFFGQLETIGIHLL